MKNDPAAAATPDYRRFIEDLKARVATARVSAARHVNRDLILLYWDIGQAIVEKQKTHNWGDAVVEMVAKDLRRAFPGMRGFSPDSIWRMRQFYSEYADPSFLEQAVLEIAGRRGKRLEQAVPETASDEFLSRFAKKMLAPIPWGHHIELLKKIKEPEARLWYLQTTAHLGWSRNVLLNQIKAGAYERAVTEKRAIISTSPCRSIWPSRPTRCSRAPTTSNSWASAGPLRNGHWKSGSSNGCGILSSNWAMASALSAASTG
ncbi:MAG: DUF1016 N-terminal domain-containing protein [Deltaproteobacteria bacterium]|nr:DUF1016 N-terminal domain-containing protein [Deltaproteobacteria bacterium]